MERDRRRHSRRPIQLDARLSDAAGTEIIATCVDLSLGGAQLHLKAPPAYGTALSLTLSVPPSATLTIPVTARWSGPAMLGVQFGRLRAKDAYLLAELLATLPRHGADDEDEDED